MKISGSFLFLLLILSLTGMATDGHQAKPGVKAVIDGVVTRLYKTYQPQQLDTIQQNFVLSVLTNQEKMVLATQYWTFRANVPVIVSLMRDQAQKVLPFWLKDSGFRKTGLVVKNEEYTYEVWQKPYDAGVVSLGINGFDKHRPVYFISVKPQQAGAPLHITPIFPAHQTLTKFQPGAYTYHDWSDLTLNEVPESLRGQTLFQTIRGRAREAHLVGAFRRTKFPATTQPDQLLLTWSGNPANTQDIQWRTAASVPNGVVKYWQKGSPDTLVKAAVRYTMEDRLLENDRYVHRFTTKLTGLKSGQTYDYQVGSTKGRWSAVASFQTQSNTREGFSFIWFGDTHKSPVWGTLAQQTLTRHPNIAFYSIAGDLVSTGLHRDEWDELWQYSGTVFQSKPLLPIPGNHDSQDGLGAWMYQQMFSLPHNGPRHAEVPDEQTYAFTYKNALFLFIDATAPIDAQTAWIKQQLAQSKADWKFMFFHFPPYTFEEDYADIRKAWGPLIDRYHVDMVMSGHVHYYMRSKPTYNGKSVASAAQGTIYTISIGIPSEHEIWPDEAYAALRYKTGPFYQLMDIQGKKLTYTVYNKDGQIKDELVLTK
ncbi:purple acid phosphatase family protein [Spirosoma endbachense]|uniref:Metallophosphoesterase n=1 Tax=Spirosoma endbachense TaxID=2666025 RepID=A0A6P1VY55_9BACT|nr:metallophosphoesterase family protein [Spirosoma endbachense]QHV98141.1 metallophosphoesterase [Spirosoma endbachense]